MGEKKVRTAILWLSQLFRAWCKWHQGCRFSPCMSHSVKSWSWSLRLSSSSEYYAKFACLVTCPYLKCFLRSIGLLNYCSSNSLFFSLSLFTPWCLIVVWCTLLCKYMKKKDDSWRVLSLYTAINLKTHEILISSDISLSSQPKHNDI